MVCGSDENQGGNDVIDRCTLCGGDGGDKIIMRWSLDGYRVDMVMI